MLHRKHLAEHGAITDHAPRGKQPPLLLRSVGHPTRHHTAQHGTCRHIYVSPLIHFRLPHNLDGVVRTQETQKKKQQARTTKPLVPRRCQQWMHDGSDGQPRHNNARTHPPCANQGKASAARCLTPVATIPAIGVLVGSTIPFSRASRSTSRSTSAEDAPPSPTYVCGEGHTCVESVSFGGEGIIAHYPRHLQADKHPRCQFYPQRIGWVELTLVIGNQEHRRRGARARTSLVVVVLLPSVPRKMQSWRISGSLKRGLPPPCFFSPFVLS